MKISKYDKLVRDKIPEYLENIWVESEYTIESGEKLEKRLLEKLSEESSDLIEDKNMEEIADVLEVLISYARFKWFDWQEIEEIRKNKLDERGWFYKWIVLKETIKN